MSNETSNDVSVLLNSTQPGSTTLSLSAEKRFAVGINPFSVVAADVNGDGKKDLITANPGDGTVSVLTNIMAPGATEAAFNGQQTFAAVSRNFAAVVADVDGDGKPDLIVSNNGDTTITNPVSVLINTTPAPTAILTMASSVSFLSSTGPASVALADLSGDGRPDIVVATGSGISALVNTTGTGQITATLSAKQDFPAGTNASFVATGDFNLDGKPDLVVAERQLQQAR